MDSSSSRTSTSSKSTKHDRWRHRLKFSLPNKASEWTRQHAKTQLNISYASNYIQKPMDLLLKISGIIRDLTEEQLEYIELVQQYLQFNYPLKSFYQSNDLVEDALNKCLENIKEQESEQISEKTWSILMVKAFLKLRVFINGLKTLARDLKDYRKVTHPYEGLLTGFIGEFADLCCLKVEYCNQARPSIWDNLKGIKVTSEPDLRLYQCGLETVYSDMNLVSVVEVKPEYYYTNETMEPPKKKLRGSPRRASTNTEENMSETESSVQDKSMIGFDLHDQVLGQHSANLLLDLHKKHKNDEPNKYKDEQVINMLGMIVDGTRVFFTVLEMTWKHYQKLVQNKQLDNEDKATIYYSTSKDILQENERKILIENFLRLNNIEFTLFPS